MGRGRLTISTLLMAFALAVLVSFSCIMCLVDAFVLECRPPMLLLLCCGVALLAVLGMLPQRIWLTTLTAMAAFLGILLWRHEQFVEQLNSFLFAVTTLFASAYDGIPILGTSGSCHWLLAALAFPTAWLIAWIVCREASAAFAFVGCLPVLILCLLVVDVAPVFWLILLTVALLLLLLTHSVRERSAADGSRLA